MRKLLIGAATFITLSGCRYAPFDPQQICVMKEGAVFNLQSPGSCKYYQALTGDVSSGLVNSGLARPGEVAWVLSNYDFWVNDAWPHFSCYGDIVAGCTQDWDHTIGLNRAGAELAHEMMHAISALRTGDPNSHHVFWDSEGANADAPQVNVMGNEELVGSIYNVTDISYAHWDWIYKGYWTLPASRTCFTYAASAP
jgi:hypothetical protein